MPDKPDLFKPRLFTLIIGIGLALTPIHNTWITEALSNSAGVVILFIPRLGYLLLLLGAGLLLVNNWQYAKSVGFGDRRLIYGLIVIAAAIALSGVAYIDWVDRFAPAGMALGLLACYMAGRILGKGVFLPLAIGAGIASLGVIVHSIIVPGQVTGGYIFEYNYDVVVGYVLLGAALYKSRWQWILASLALIAMLLSGSPEAIFSVGIMVIVVLARRDMNRWLLIPAVGVIVILGIWFALGWGQELYRYLLDAVCDNQSVAIAGGADPGRQPITYRFEQIAIMLRNIQVLGSGYNLTAFHEGIVHNVPMILIQQMGLPGIAAAIAWLSITVYCLIRTKYKYAWTLIIVLSIWDHYIWTQLAPVWWLLVGVSTVDKTNDYIFRGVYE